MLQPNWIAVAIDCFNFLNFLYQKEADVADGGYANAKNG